MKKIAVLVLTLNLLGLVTNAEEEKPLDITVEATRVSVEGLDVSWSPINKLVMKIDGQILISGFCGEMSHVNWAVNEYNKVLLRVPVGKKIRITGSQLCPINSNTVDAIKFELVD